MRLKNSPSRGRAPLSAFALVALCVCALLPAAAPPRPARANPAAPDENRTATLTPGSKIERETPPGAAHEFALAVEAGQFARLSVERRGGAAVVTLSDPAGAKLAEFACREDGPTPLSLVAETAGAYRLTVRAADEGGGAARYTVEFVELRAAVERDAQRLLAERAFAEAEELRRVWKAEARRAAVEKYGQARAGWRAAGERREEAAALVAEGEVLFTMGDPRRALDSLGEALRLSRAAGDQRRASRALSNLGYVRLSVGDPRRARAHGEEALRLSRATGDRRGEAQALNALGEVKYFAGDLRGALSFYERALPLWREAGDRRGEAQTLFYFGSSYADLSETKQAADYYGEALALWRACGDARGVALTLTAVGNLHSTQGDKQQALERYYEARALFEPSCDPLEEARLLNGIGFVYDELGEKRRALEFYEQALGLFRAAGYRRGEATNLLNLGEIHHALGDYAPALDYCRQALAMFRALGDRRIEAFALKDIGLVYDAQGREAEALEHYRAALRLNRAGGDKREEAYALNNIGHVSEELGDLDAALGFYRQALALNRAARDRFGESSTHFNIARAERARGRLDEARARLEAALGLAETLRSGVASQELRASYFASIHQRYETYVALLMQLHRERPSEGFDAAALEASERARSRSLLETLAEAQANVRGGVEPALLERERALQQALNQKAERQGQLLAGRHTAEEARRAAAEVDRAVAEYEEVRSQIRADSPRYAALTQPQTVSLREIQQSVLDDETVMLEFSLGGERSHLWAVTRGEVRTYELPDRATVEGAARRLYELLTAPQPVPGETAEQRRARAAEAEARLPAHAADFSRMLLGEAAPLLRNKRLLIVPDGALQYVPFQVLPEPGAAGGGQAGEAAGFVPLVRDHEIVYASSASVLALLRREAGQRRQPPKAVAVLADPVFESGDPRVRRAAGSPLEDPAAGRALRQALRDDGALAEGGALPRLLASKDEAEAIGSLSPGGGVFQAVGFEASREAALSPALGEYRIVHFATHSFFNVRHQELSGIVLSLVDRAGRPRDGFLRLHDIYNLNLPVELVVLSACNTGLGKDVRGEGFVGLTRGFLHAGAAGVMASLWKVDDEATAELMKQFYAGVLTEGLPPAAALRRAQMSLRQQRRWRSPYYWAGFVLQGEYRGRAAAPAPARAGLGGGALLAAGAFVTLFSVGGVYALRRRRRERPAA